MKQKKQVKIKCRLKESKNQTAIIITIIIIFMIVFVVVVVVENNSIADFMSLFENVRSSIVGNYLFFARDNFQVRKERV